MGRNLRVNLSFNLSSMKPISVIILLAAIIINANTLYANSNDTLPSADNRDHVSPVSIRGIIDTVSDSIITIQFENETNKIKKQKIRVITKTKIFTEYGGVVFIDELSAGQYLWIWYPLKEGKVRQNPRRAAVIILWSKDSKDQPTDDIKKGDYKGSCTKLVIILTSFSKIFS